MRGAVERSACNSNMVRLCVLVFFATALAEGLQNKYCGMSCEYDENLTFAHTVCERGKQVGGFCSKFVFGGKLLVKILLEMRTCCQMRKRIQSDTFR